MTIQDVAFAAYTNLPDGMEAGLEDVYYYDPPNMTYPFGSYIVVVEVDTGDGTWKVLDMVAVDDCGVRINPMIVAGQIAGGLTEGFAKANMQWITFDDEGNCIGANFLEYLVPTAWETPRFAPRRRPSPRRRTTPSAPRASASPPLSGRRRRSSTPWSTPCGRTGSPTSTCRCSPTGCGAPSTESKPSRDGTVRRGTRVMDVFARAAQLRAEGAPFALATVTWRQGPSSGRTGAQAIIGADGAVDGWLGGACAQPTVVAAALDSLRDGRPRLLVMGVDDPRPDVASVPMACSSEGAMEVFVQPHLAPPHVHAIGSSPMVATLARLAEALGWRVSTTDDPDVTGVGRETFVVVATQGHYDEPALEAALATPARYVGLVASAKRAAAVTSWLAERGVDEAALARVRSPAGLDLGSVEHEEMAVAVLAELVAVKAMAHTEVEVPVLDHAVDPVCGMAVDVATTRFRTDHQGVTHFFCAPGCQRAFEADPAAFLGG